MWRRLIRLLLRLYPADFRRRFGPEVERALRDLERRGPGAGERLFVLIDALRTLCVAWSGRIAVLARTAAVSPLHWLVAATGDARVALRAIWRRPLASVVVVGTLALAIGANAAIFTITKALLLESLPYAAPDRIALVERMAGFAAAGPVVQRALRESPQVVATALYLENGGANLVEGSQASRVRITHVSPDFFRVLGVDLLLGPGLPADAAGEPTVVLGHALWRTVFAGEASSVGRSIRLSGRPFTVVGVAPRDVEFPGGTELWVSLPAVPEFFGMAFGVSTIARVKPGVTVPGLEASLQAVAREERGRQEGDPPPEEYWLPAAIGLRAELTRAVRLPLFVLSGAAALVLLLGCVNVAGMAVARLPARQDELAVRRALGAGRAHIFVQLLVEMLVPAVIGGAASVAVSHAAVPVLRSLLPAETPGLSGVVPDASLLLVTALATLAAGLAAGLLPALAGVRARADWRIGAGVTDDRGRLRLHSVLAATQIALAVTLVSGAVLLGRSLMRLRDVPLGFDASRVLTFEVRLPSATYAGAAAWERYRARVTTALAALPGVQAAGAISQLPLTRGLGVGLQIRAEGEPDESARTASYLVASGDYFRAMGVSLLEGRTFEDRAAAEAEVLLSSTLARTLFPDGKAVGRRVLVHSGPPAPATVVGVVADVRRRGPLLEVGLGTFYEPLTRWPAQSLGFAVRSSLATTSIASAVRAALADVDPTVPAYAMRTTGDAVRETLATQRAVALMSGLFAAAALILAALGVYGLVAQGVARRRRELGIRLALGARSGELMWMVLRGGLQLALVGLALGAAGAVAAGRVIRTLLYGVRAADPLTLVLVVVAIGLTVLAATILPARQAARTDPAQSLRSS